VVCWFIHFVRIAMLSTPFVAVPPSRYGGTELVVSELVAGLVALGHEVTLFATGDSRAPCEVRWLYARAIWPPEPRLELAHASWAADQLRRGRFDVVHSHVPSLVALARLFDAPLVHTVHHPHEPQLTSIYRRGDAHLIAISARQRALTPELARATVIHHGLDPARHPLGHGDGGYCAFLGRYSQQKGVAVAVDAARRAGVPIRVAGRAHWDDHEYYEATLVPRLRLAGVREVGELGGTAKVLFLGCACALLFPIDWEEPFGLVMIEAMLCGTPVLAFDRGSVRELVEDGVTGFVCSDAYDLARRVHALRARGFDRARCRARAMQRFCARRMVAEHVSVYEHAARAVEIDAQRAAPGA
jgi:glycosyltransferase involved in cell wall biosynthesis